MDIDPLDIVESAKPEAPAVRHRWLNPAVAITVALLATFMGICKACRMPPLPSPSRFWRCRRSRS